MPRLIKIGPALDHTIFGIVVMMFLDALAAVAGGAFVVVYGDTPAVAAWNGYSWPHRRLK